MHSQDQVPCRFFKHDRVKNMDVNTLIGSTSVKAGTCPHMADRIKVVQKQSLFFNLEQLMGLLFSHITTKVSFLPGLGYAPLD